ncbi:sulfite reductase flavoprotein alpha-component [Tricladium varicosporioides]|nr:sulfite reductase flavoprotein alpha-component [Hymenoscyphus varicosporioides]
MSGSEGGGRCPMGNKEGRVGPRGCNFMNFEQQGDVRAAFDIPSGVDANQYLRQRERKAINELLYSNVPSMPSIKEIQVNQGVKSLDALNASEQDLLAVALGAPARQVLLRAEEVGPRTGWRDGYLSTEYGFTPPDADAAAGALARSPGRVWSDLCERMPGCVARGRVRESVAALPVIEGTEDFIPDKALWAALVSLGMLCSIYRYEDKHNGTEGVNVTSKESSTYVEMSDELGDEVKGIPKSIGLPYYQICKRMGRSIPHLTFFDQSSYNLKIRDPTSVYPYVGRFDNTDLRWPMFGDQSEIAFLKGCADTSASFQHGVDAIASCQEHVMSRNNDALLREMIRLKEILERMPNAFHSISMNPNSGDNYVSPAEWVRWAKFSAPLSKRCPATSGLQFPPYLVMDAFLGRTKYESFLGAEGVHLRAWLPSNWRAFIASIEYHYRIPDYVQQSGDQRLMGALDGIVEAYTGERGFMGTHRYKVFGLLEVAGKTGRAETNGNSGSSEANARPWEETHQAFSEAMKERLEPYRGNLHVEPHQMRGTFAECRYKSRVLSRTFVDSDPDRSIARVCLDIQETGITFQPGDRLAIMPHNSWMECAKVAAALGLDTMLDQTIHLEKCWSRFAEHLGSVSNIATPQLTVKDVLRRGHLAPLTKELVMKLHTMLRASSNTLLQVLATTEWPVRASLGDLLQAAVAETPSQIWDQAFDINGNLSWLTELIPIEVPRTYSISNSPDELLPSTVDLTVSRSEFNLCPILSGNQTIIRHGVGSSFLNPPVSENEFIADDEELLIGVSRPLSFQLPIDDAAPCAFFAGGSGIAPFRSFWQARAGRSVGKNILFLGVQSREKFCYESELREYVDAGLMEVYTAFSRDSRGLVYDRRRQDLVEKEIAPRYIDSLAVEQGAMVCDLVMSKKQGGLGGYMYVCGSLSVFDSVMSGIRKAIYNHRTASMESTDQILDIAFAERRFMLDVFMSPKPLPCNIPTIPLSQLAMHTGHTPNSRIHIAVHGSVYDVTDFCPMHPGGTNIIKSNAGVDCSKSFDLLAHTNNPEVSSLLNKYFIGHLTPKPDYHHCEEISMLYDLWADYLRTSVETLVAHQFEVHEFMESSKLWFQGSLFNMGGVRRFYHHQSRLLQNGFSALFGAKLQELFLKLSFTLANATSGANSSRLPDVLGIIARAKGSQDAMTTTNEISQIGQFTCDSETARFHEQGILTYARASVQLNMELLEGIREEACRGMDAFDTVMSLDAPSDTHRLTALSTFLLQVAERMAMRLESFYSKLAPLSVYHPEMEQNPARTRWTLLRRKIRDGSFFVLTQDLGLLPQEGARNPYMGQSYGQRNVELDQVISQIQASIKRAPTPHPRNTDLTSQHISRGQAASTSQPSAYESSQDQHALKRMSSFMSSNMKAIRRLSKMPPQGSLSFEQLMNTYRPTGNVPTVPTPPSSRGSSRSRSSSQDNVNPIMAGMAALNMRSQSQNQNHTRNPSSGSLNRHVPGGVRPLSPPISTPNTPPLSAIAALPSLFSKLNKRQKPGQQSPLPSPAASAPGMPIGMGMRSSMASMNSLNSRQSSRSRSGSNDHARARSLTTGNSGNGMRGFMLGQAGSGMRGREEVRIAPTF